MNLNTMHTPSHTHLQLLDMNEHAALWPDLVIHTRHALAGTGYDVTVGTHSALGLCIVSHAGLGELVSWITTAPIPDALTD